MVIYVDESIHENLGFTIIAFVAAEHDLKKDIKKALIDLDYVPGKDEFKSSTRMINNPRMQILRMKYFNIVRSKSKIAVLVTSSHDRKILGHEILNSLANIIRKNGLKAHGLHVLFDTGLCNISKIDQQAAVLKQDVKGIRLKFNQDSKSVLGIQLADAVAHTIAQILKEQITGKSKKILLGETYGYDNQTEFELGWALLMSLRYSFFVRRVFYKNKHRTVDARTEPLFIDEDEDIVEFVQHPDLFGWGIFVSNNCTNKIKLAVNKVFDKIWLGCIH